MSDPEIRVISAGKSLWQVTLDGVRIGPPRLTEMEARAVAEWLEEGGMDSLTNQTIQASPLVRFAFGAEAVYLDPHAVTRIAPFLRNASTVIVDGEPHAVTGNTDEVYSLVMAARQDNPRSPGTGGSAIQVVRDKP